MAIKANRLRKTRGHNTKHVYAKGSLEESQYEDPIEPETLSNQSNSKFIPSDPLTQQQIVAVLTEMSRHLLMLLRQETDRPVPVSAATPAKHRHQAHVLHKNTDSKGA